MNFWMLDSSNPPTLDLAPQYSSCNKKNEQIHYCIDLRDLNRACPKRRVLTTKHLVLIVPSLHQQLLWEIATALFHRCWVKFTLKATLVTAFSPTKTLSQFNISSPKAILRRAPPSDPRLLAPLNTPIVVVFSILF